MTTNGSTKWVVPDEAEVIYIQDGKDTCCVLEISGANYLGYSQCGRRDRYNPELGKSIAFGRAAMKYNLRMARKQSKREHSFHFKRG